MKFPDTALFLLLAFPVRAEYDGPPAEKAKWISFCVESLRDTKETEPARRVYCRCVSEVADTADFRRVYDWERIFPPAHLSCFEKARFKPGG